MAKAFNINSMMIRGRFFYFKFLNFFHFLIEYSIFRVLYFSLHRFDYGNFWPNLRQSDFDFIGEKEGKGYNINIPLNKVVFLNYFILFIN